MSRTGAVSMLVNAVLGRCRRVRRCGSGRIRSPIGEGHLGDAAVLNSTKESLNLKHLKLTVTEVLTAQSELNVLSFGEKKKILLIRERLLQQKTIRNTEQRRLMKNVLFLNQYGVENTVVTLSIFMNILTKIIPNTNVFGL